MPAWLIKQATQQILLQIAQVKVCFPPDSKETQRRLVPVTRKDIIRKAFHTWKQDMYVFIKSIIRKASCFWHVRLKDAPTFNDVLLKLVVLDPTFWLWDKASQAKLLGQLLITVWSTKLFDVKKKKGRTPRVTLLNYLGYHTFWHQEKKGRTLLG